ncbi:MAG: MBL fold metallo-hydrolase [Methyloligellaceae bacterium]
MVNITGYSTARYGTWYFLEQHNLLFDAGDGVVANLRGKCGKIRHIFLSHADRDHLGGLIQLYQTIAQSDNTPKFYYPKDSGSIPALRDFLQKFDPHLPHCEWIAVEGGMHIEVARNLFVKVGENNHIAVAQGVAPELVKSLDFSLVETRRKLKPEFHKLPGQEIGRLREEKGEEHITVAEEHVLFGYSGDAPSFDVERWQGTEILIHEATFLAPGDSSRGHCELGDVIRSAGRLDLKALILGHISVRYKEDEIRPAILEGARAGNIRFPIYALFPGDVVEDILSKPPVWSPLSE